MASITPGQRREFCYPVVSDFLIEREIATTSHIYPAKKMSAKRNKVFPRVAYGRLYSLWKSAKNQFAKAALNDKSDATKRSPATTQWIALANREFLSTVR
jgi:hypothetical protein